MQTGLLKIVALLCVTISFCARGQAPTLHTADSLFSAKKYTQALALYTQLLDRQLASPAMLLKMALIQEGLGNVAYSQKCLYQYYQLTNDGRALARLEEVAARHRLEGYGLDEVETWKAAAAREWPFARNVALAVCGLVLTCAAYFRRQGYRARVWLGVVAVTILLLHLGNYYLQPTARAMSKPGLLYIMNGPSAGASVIEVVEGGHLFTQLGQRDVWVRIAWRGQEAYVKESQVWPL
jgi:hypothetical protein